MSLGDTTNLAAFGGVEAELRALSVRYFTAIDARDAEGFAHVFLPNGRLIAYTADDEQTSTGEWTGHDAIGQFAPLLAQTYAHTFHLMGQASYEISSDQATGLVYCVAHHLARAARGAINYVMYIRYRDSYQRDTEDAWKIAIRRVVISWTELRAAE